jgi:hypothetical protein
MMALLVLLFAAPNLDVERLPRAVPETLAMRAETPAPPPAPPAEVAKPAEPPAVPLEQKVIFKFQLGYAVDQGRELEGVPLPTDVRKTRVAYLGDLVLGTRGLLRASLATYLATHFYFDQSGSARFQALPEIYDAFPDGQAVLVRSGWAQLDGFLGGVFAPVWLRAGRQWRWGQAGVSARFDGLAIGWEGETVQASLWGGRRVGLFNLADRFGLGGDTGAIAGSSFRLRLRKLVKLPLALTADTLGWEGTNVATLGLEADVPGTVDAAARLRWLDGKPVQLAGTMRARLSKVTTLQVELDERFTGDWTYDYVVAADDTTGNNAMRLHFGEPIPRFRASVRGGTVLFENWDLLVTGATVWEHADPDESSFQPTYLEGGAGVSARFFGGLTIGVELRARHFYRDLAANVPLADVGSLGETASREGVGRLRYSLGVKRFTGEITVYARQLLVDRVLGEGRDFLVTGAQFRVEGWVNQRMRLVTEYELAGEPGEELARFVNLRGLQSLRVLAEATF